ncbi:MAG: hypothetical protein ACRENO_03870 [Thermodesulfobacteriota bacterium]
MNQILSKLESLIDVNYFTQWLLASGIRIILIVIISYVLFKILRATISRVEKTALKDRGEFVSSLELEKRVVTIGNILRKIVFLSILLIASMLVLKGIGEGLKEDEYFGTLILEPMDILGVDNFVSSEVVIKCMIKTIPLKQWEVGRELRRRIKIKFDELNIEIPYPHMSVYFGETSSQFKHELSSKEGAKGLIEES